MTICFFIFHAGAVAVPLFLQAHNQFLMYETGISFWTMPQSAADILAWGVVLSGAALILRRMALAEVRIMSRAPEYLVLILCLAPFVTGLACRYGASGYRPWLILHIVSGEILLMAIPFTRLSHVLLFFLSRGQIGMDFGIKRGGMRGRGVAW